MRSGKKNFKVKPKIGYFGIRVRNFKRSIDFYTKVLGMRVVRRGKMPHGGRYIGLRSPKSESELELNWYPKDSAFYTPFKRGEELDHIAFGVGKGKVLTAYEELVKKGAKVAVPPKRAAKEETEVYLKDPDGNWIELLDWD